MEKFLDKFPKQEVILALYEETVLEVGIDYLKNFVSNTKIELIFLIGNYGEDVIESIHEIGLKTGVSVTYYLTDFELEKAKRANGFIYMQAFPYEREIKFGYTNERLSECIKILRENSINLPIYCAKGIRKTSDIQIIKEAGADGYILGSFLLKNYNKPHKVKKIVELFD